MNILFISPDEKPDYQRDALFHGLYELPDITIYTNTDLWFMFEGNEQEKISKLYGKGFSLYNRIKGVKHIEEPSVIREKIKSKFYDCIIYGKFQQTYEYINDVLKSYSQQEIIFIDGEDYDFSFEWNLRPWWKIKHYGSYYNQYCKSIDISHKGLYFKRELRDCDRKYFYPIQFAIPEQNIVTAPFPDKTREQAFIVPGKLDTYIYDNEKDYYEGYAVSKYAITTKKGGWDCLRHYEILANRCIPYFKGIERCPTFTLPFLPKTLIQETNKLIETGKLTDSRCEYYSNIFYDITKNMLTTKQLAKYVLSTVCK